MPEGFFKNYIPKPKRTTSRSLDSCESCGLYRNCHSPKMEYTGEGKRKVLIVAEAPGQTEDREGIQLIGRAGQVLRDFLSSLDWDLDRDCWKTNALRCWPGKGNPTPTLKQIRSCHPYLIQTIKELKPKVILLLGKEAIRSYLLDRVSVGNLTKWRGWIIPDQEIQSWVCPTFHPSFVMRSEGEHGGNPTVRLIFEQDLKRALSKVDDDFPIEWALENDKKRVNILTEQSDIASYLEEINQNPPKQISIDYETTGLKPWRKGHRVLCMAVSKSSDDSTVFPIEYYTDEEMKSYKNHASGVKNWALLNKLLTNSKIGKIAHNLKFEHNWSREALGIIPKNWIWDSMLAAHVLDNRSGITGLKTQVFINFGILGYDDTVKPYISPSSAEKKKYGANAFNRMYNCPIKDMLLYCGLDALYTHRLAKKQMLEMGVRAGRSRNKLFKAYKLLHNGTLALADVEANGIAFDDDHFSKQFNALSRKIKKTKQKIDNDPDVTNWEKSEGGKKFNPASPDDVKKLLYNYKKIEPTKTTDKGNASIHQSVLEKLTKDYPIVKSILDLRSLTKTRSTNIEGMIREAWGGFLHPTFSLNTVRTYRSSSSEPNFQNIPIRNDMIRRIIRGGLVARPGRQLLEVDYSGIEVRIAACYHQDPTMLKYINDPSNDMHRDMAAECFLMEPDQVTKELRYSAKNGFVFPQFYGDYYKPCAKAMWAFIQNKFVQDQTVVQWLKRQGIKNIHDFTDHIQDVEYRFWNERFPVYNQWKKQWVNRYYKTARLEMYTGFRCQGVLNKNDIVNYPIQGTAFHCLLWSLIQIVEKIKEEKWKSKVIGQIHDSVVMELEPSERDYVLTTLKKIMCEDIRKQWSWIMVPLDIEAEITPIDGSWLEKEKIAD